MQQKLTLCAINDYPLSDDAKSLFITTYKRSQTPRSCFDSSLLCQRKSRSRRT
ncbi:hypothetical protein H1P_3610003 [Hyella patelloides LEGE 07179]|uniref:Uncharacterized protein n=1 Tax=Hyella patelloides LEGE 07179 TaxID=945734 RepID=A0A563VW82_9CYAN|nr:hypothetical protein H1P_3610003 [Hyella patelloides LEGE 07179]